MQKSPMKKIQLTLLGMIMGLIFCLSLPGQAHAVEWFKHQDQYHFHSKTEQLFDLKVSDVKYPFNWVHQTQTYTCNYVDPTSGRVSYFWNVPNLQQLCWNELYGLFATSGYVGETDESARPKKYDNAVTAEKKFGYHIPSYAYIGEYPRIIMDFGNVVIPDGFLEWAGVLWGGITGGSVVGDVDESDLKTMRYIFPNDYSNVKTDIVKFMHDNWSDISAYCEENNVHVECKKNGKVKFTFPDDVDPKMLEPKNQKRYSKKLQNLFGDSFSNFANDVIQMAVAKNPDCLPQSVVRSMPYVLDNLNPDDAAQLAVPDPRAQIQQQTTLQLGLERQLNNVLQMVGVEMNARMAETAATMNKICSFEFLDKVGFDTGMVWLDQILNLFVPIAVMGYILLCVKTLFQMVRAKKGFGGGLSTLLCGLLALALFVGITTAKEPTLNLCKTTANYCFNLGTLTADYSSSFKQLYDQEAKLSDKAQLRFWVLYFAPWTKYQTGVEFNDPANMLDVDSDLPEQYLMTEYPTLKNKKIKLWSAVLADAFWRPQSAQGNQYRALDHFMAPRIKTLSVDDCTVQVTENENYRGYVQTSFDWGYVVANLVMFLLAAAKTLCFAEAVIRIMLLITNLAIRATGLRGGMREELKSCGAAFLRVGMLDILITMEFLFVMQMNSFWVGIFSIALFGVLVTVVQILRRTGSIWKPQWITLAEKVGRKVADFATDLPGGVQDNFEGAIAIGRTMKDDKVISRRG